MTNNKKMVNMKINQNIFKTMLVILSLLVLVSCDIFEPRDNDDPNDNVNIPWISFPIIYQQAVDNLESAYEYAQPIGRYKHMLTDDFQFIFASQDVADYGTPSKLTAAEEDEMLSHLHKVFSYQKRDIDIVLTPIPDQEDVEGANKTVIYRDYILTISGEGYATEVKSGSLELTLVEINGQWNIKKWIDYRKDSKETWGKMKYEFTL